jgi:hypothetical protein
VHCNHFSQRIDHNSLHCIDDIIKNLRIVERFAHPIIARRRGPREPLVLAVQAALRDSLQELTVEEAKPRHHWVVSGFVDNILDH